jgi:hypothetical protein
MTDRQRLEKLLRSESLLKQTKAGYKPDGPFWKKAMPLLWEVRVDLGSSGDGAKLAEAHGLLKKTEKGYDPTGPRWKRAMGLIDQVEASLDRPPVPALGPVYRNDKSVLLYVPTHNTDGIRRPGQPSVYPAFDSGWTTGKVILAPERLKVTKQSSAQGADAFYATGVSTLEYWFGHVQQAPATGAWFEKGEALGKIARISAADGGPHLHLGINAMALIGRDLRWGRNGNGPDYTYGSPTIGVQLTEAMSA